MDKRKAYIYKITSPSNKIYIGQTIDLIARKSKYKTLKCKSQPRIYNSLNKYGWDNHIFEILEEIQDIDYNIINEREIYWINYYNSLDENGLNCRSGGNNYIMSDETKEKLRQINLGKTAINKGIACPDKTKEKIRNTARGKHIGHKNGFYNKKHTDNTKEKMKLAKKGPTKVICLDDNLIFNTVKEACQYYKSNYISDVCKGRKNKTSNKSFMYYDDYLKTFENEIN